MSNLRVSAYGRLVKDVTARQTANGKDMAYTTLVCDVTPWQKDGDERQEQSLFIQVMAFGKLAGVLARQSKGDMVAITGDMTQSTYTAKDGTERTSFSVVAGDIVSSKTVRPTRKQATIDESFDDELPEW